MPHFDDHQYWVRRTQQGGLKTVGHRRFSTQTNELFYRRVRAALLKLIEQRVPDKRASVLDAGAGIGYYSQALYDAGFREMTACDISEQALATIERPIKKVVAPLESMRSKLGTTYDLVLCFDVLYHIIEDAVFEKAIENLCQVSNKYIFIHGAFPQFIPLRLVQHVKFRTLSRHDMLFASHGFKRVEIRPTQFLTGRLPWVYLYKILPSLTSQLDEELLKLATGLSLHRFASQAIVVYQRTT
ncbi:MAG: methyltransferase domain-containing protein [Patescibacteria group bacterium]